MNVPTSPIPSALPVGAASLLTGYRVRFLNDLPDSTGHVRPCCQRTIEVVAAGREAALAEARVAFERLEKVPRWQLRAHRAECAAFASPPGDVPRSAMPPRAAAAARRRS